MQELVSKQWLSEDTEDKQENKITQDPPNIQRFDSKAQPVWLPLPQNDLTFRRAFGKSSYWFKSKIIL